MLVANGSVSANVKKILKKNYAAKRTTEKVQQDHIIDI
jgi:hypothetical protein